jgi:Zn finger protein HypA/HybF involved in hydrogenase expression
MTKTLLETNIMEIKNIKVTCKCGIILHVPLSSKNLSAFICPECDKKLPLFVVGQLREALVANMLRVEQGDGVKIALETEPD